MHLYSSEVHWQREGNYIGINILNNKFLTFLTVNIGKFFSTVIQFGTAPYSNIDLFVGGIGSIFMFSLTISGLSRARKLFMRHLLPFTAFVPCLIVTYSYMGLATPRYFLSGLPILLIIISITIANSYKKIKSREVKNKFLGALTIFLFLTFALWGAKVSIYNNKTGDPQVYEAAKWISQNTPNDSLVANMEPGIMGFFSMRKVINLDGLLDYEAIEALKENKIQKFIREKRVDYVVCGRPNEKKIYGVENCTEIGKKYICKLNKA